MMSRNLAVVTSCSAEGWRAYGARFVETFNQFWPTEVDLYIVSEDLLGYQPNGARSTFVWSLIKRSPAAQAFITRHHKNLWVRGDATQPRPADIAPRWKGDRGYWFRYDAYKFCKKVFAIDAVAKHLKRGRLLWIDADVITFAPVPLELGQQMLPDGAALSCLARSAYHSECGFVGYNLDHPDALHFIDRFAYLYSSDEVFKLNEWHDSWVFDWLRKQLKTPTYHIPHKSQGHPFINSELGRYMDHLKGGRKKQGYSHPHEQIKHPSLPYWGKR